LGSENPEPPYALAVPSEVSASALDQAADVTWGSSGETQGQFVVSATSNPPLARRTQVQRSWGPPGWVTHNHFFSGLLNGASYDIAVQAEDSLTGERSEAAHAPMPVTPAGPEWFVNPALDPPLSVRATARDGRAVLTWVPAPGADPYATRYQVTMSGGATWTTWGTGYLVPDLRNDEPYSFEVRTIGLDGSVSEPTFSDFVVPRVGLDRPLAPTNLVATATGTDVKLEWGVEDYTFLRPGPHSPHVTIYASASDPLNDRVIVAPMFPDNSFTARDLADEETYTFRVTLTGLDGVEGLLSEPTTPTLVTSSLPASTHLSATPYDAAAVLAWDPVEGAAGYRVTALVDGTPQHSWWSSATTTVAPDLENGTVYTFSVAAVSPSGVTSRHVATSALTTPDPSLGESPAELGPLLLVAGSRASESVVVSWLNSNQFDLEWARDEAFTDPSERRVTAADSSDGTYLVKGLAIGAQYWVRARTDNSEPWVTRAITTAEVPDAPEGFVATATSESSITLEWLGDGVLELERATNPEATAFTPVAGPLSSPLVVADLEAGTPYAFRLRRSSAPGPGAPGQFGPYAYAAATTPFALSAPEVDVVHDEDDPFTRARLSAWVPDGAPSGTGFEAELSTSAAFDQVTPIPVTDGAAVLSGLTADTAYWVRARSVDGSRHSPWKEHAFRTHGAPQAPEGLLALATETGISASWEESAFVSSWVVEYSLDSDFSDATELSVSVPSVEFSTSTEQTTYLRVRAVNAAGQSEPASTSVTPPVAPETPTGIYAAPAETSVFLFWEVPDGFPSAYRLYRDSVLVGQTPFPRWYDDGLATGTQYLYQVSAVNRFGGESALSEPVLARPFPAPPVIEDLTAVARNASVDLTWAPPAASSGTVTYRVYIDDVLVQSTTSTSVSLPLRNGVTRVVSVSAVDIYGQVGPTAATSVRPVQPGIGQIGAVKTDGPVPILANLPNQPSVRVGDTTYVAVNNQVFRYVAGQPVTSFGTVTAGCASGPAGAARFSATRGLSAEAGFLFVTDACGTRKLDPRDGSVTMLSSWATNGLNTHFAGRTYVLTSSSVISSVSDADGTTATFATAPSGYTFTKLVAGNDGVYASMTKSGAPTLVRLHRIDGTSADVLSGSLSAASFTVIGDHLYFAGTAATSAGGAYLACKIYDLDLTSSSTRYLLGSGTCGRLDGVAQDGWLPANLNLFGDDDRRAYFFDGTLLRHLESGTPVAPPGAQQPTSGFTGSTARVDWFSGRDVPSSPLSGSATDASHSNATGFVVEGSTVVEAAGSALRRVDLTTGASTLLYGKEGASGCVDSADKNAVTYSGIQSLTSDGRYYYVGSCGIRRTDVSTGATSTVTSEVTPLAMAFRKGAIYAVTSSSPAQLVRIDPATGVLTTVASLTANCVSPTPSKPVFSNDRLYMSFRCVEGPYVYYVIEEYDLDTTAHRTIVWNTAYWHSNPNARPVVTPLYANDTTLFFNSGARLMSSPLTWNNELATLAALAGNGVDGSTSGIGTEVMVNPTLGFSSTNGDFVLSGGKLLKVSPGSALPSANPVSGEINLVSPGKVTSLTNNPVKDQYGSLTAVDGTNPSFSTEVGGAVRVGNYVYIVNGPGIRRVNVVTNETELFVGSVKPAGMVGYYDWDRCRVGSDPLAVWTGYEDITSDGVNLYTSSNNKYCPIVRTSIATRVSSYVPLNPLNPATMIPGQGAMTFHDGYLYTSIERTRSYPAQVAKINPTTGSVTFFGEFTPDDGCPANTPYLYRDLEFVGDVLYGVIEDNTHCSYDEYDQRSRLVRINITTGTVQVLAALNVGFPDLLASNGNLFISGGRDIMRYDIATGRSEVLVGSFGSSAPLDGTGPDAWLNSFHFLSTSGRLGLHEVGGKLRFFSQGKLREVTQGERLPHAATQPLDEVTWPNGAYSRVVSGSGSSTNASGSSSTAGFASPSAILEDSSLPGSAYVSSGAGLFRVDLTSGQSSLESGRLDPPVFLQSVDCQAALAPTTDLRFRSATTLASNGHYLFAGSDCGVARVNLVNGSVSYVRSVRTAASLVAAPDGLFYGTLTLSDLDLWDGVTPTPTLMSFDPTTLVTRPLAVATAAAASYDFGPGLAGHGPLTYGAVAMRGNTLYATATFRSSMSCSVQACPPLTAVLGFDLTTGAVTTVVEPHHELGSAALGVDASGFYLTSPNRSVVFKANGATRQFLAGGTTAGYVNETPMGVVFRDVAGFATHDGKLFVLASNRVVVLSPKPMVTAPGGPTQIGELLDGATGGNNVSATDLEVPGPGPGATLVRNYSTVTRGNNDTSRSIPHHPVTGTAFGPGWTSTLDAYVGTDEQGNYGVVLPSGVTQYFTREFDSSVFGGGSWVFKAAPRVRDTLRETSSGYRYELFGGGAYTFDTEGRVTSIEDAHGQALTFTTFGSITQVSDATGVKFTATRNTGRRVTSVLDAQGKATTYGYSSSGDLVTVTAPGNTSAAPRVTSYTYAGNHYLSSVTSFDGATTRYGYDASGRLASVQGPTGNLATNTYSFTSDTEVLVSHFENGVFTGAESYRDNLPVDRFTSVNGVSTLYAHYVVNEETNNIDKVVDANGGVTELEFHTTGKLKSQTNPTGQESSTDYDGDGRVSKVQAPDGTSVTYSYDALGRVTSLTQHGAGNLGGSRTATYSYGDSRFPGQATSTTTPEGDTTTFTYDAKGLLASSTTPAGERSSFTYDAMGRKLTETAPAGNVSGASSATRAKFTTTFAYYPSGDLERVTDGLNRVVTYAYADGTASTNASVTTTYPDGSSTRTTLDKLGNPTEDRGTDGSVTTTSYDTRGLATSAHDANGLTSSSSYDHLQRLVTVTGPGGLSATNTYGVLNDLETTTYPSGAFESYTYDASHRPLQVHRSEFPGDPTRLVAKSSYDSRGRLSSTVSLGRTTTYGYDRFGELSGVNRDGVVVSYENDDDGRVVSMTYDDADGHDLTASYDYTNGRLSAVRDDRGHKASYAYNAGGDLAEVRAGSSSSSVVTSTFKHDAGRPTGMTATTASGTTLLDTTYTLGDLDQPLTRTVTGQVETGSSTFDYDSGHRATSVNGLSYGYDAGSRLTSNAGATQTYSALDVLSTAGSTLYEYDGDLNRTRASVNGTTTATYAYDALDRLESLTRPGLGTTSLAYSADGQLKAVDGTEVLFDGGELLHDGAWAYIWGPTGPLWRLDGSVAEFLLSDEAGDVRARVSSSGQLLAKASYTATGETTDAQGDLGSLGWGSLYRASGTGLLTDGSSSYYEPATGASIAALVVPSTPRQDDVYGDGTSFDPWVKRHTAELIGAAAIAAVTVIGVALAVPSGGVSLAAAAVIGLEIAGGGLAIAATFSSSKAVSIASNATAVAGAGALAGTLVRSALKRATLEAAQGAASRSAARQAAHEVPTGSCLEGNSFAAGTAVLMSDGTTKAIEDVEIGDQVRALDPLAGEASTQEVTALISGRGEKHLVDLTLADGTVVTATSNHPFWDPSTSSWVDAERVKEGGFVRTDGSADLLVTSVDHRTVQDTRVYNLTVSGPHTYLVGDVGVLVHNKSCDPWSPNYRDIAGTGPNSHHIIQDAAVRVIPGYDRNLAPAIGLQGPPVGTSPHGLATRVQRRASQRGIRGTYGHERVVAYAALRAAGLSRSKARAEIARADKYFIGKLGATLSTPTRIPWR
jgi:YD repeat-containing protein